MNLMIPGKRQMADREYQSRQFRGLSARYAPGTNHANLTPEVSGRIQSLEIACESPAPKP